MTRVGVPVAQHVAGIGLQRPACGLPDEDAAEGLVPRRHRLGERRQVGDDAVAVGGEPVPEATEPGDHLVEDQQRAMVVAQPPELGEVAVGGWVDAAGALHRLGDHGGDLAGPVGHQHGEGLGVVARHLHDVRHEGTPPGAVRRDALGARPAEVGAVVPAVAADDERALGMAGEDVCGPGQLHRRVDGLGARPAEEHAGVGDRGEGDQPFGELVGREVAERFEARVRGDRRQLRGDGLGDLGATVPRRAVPQAGHGVDVLAAVAVPDEGPGAALDDRERRRRRLGEGMQEGGQGGAGHPADGTRSSRTLLPRWAPWTTVPCGC